MKLTRRSACAAAALAAALPAHDGDENPPVDRTALIHGTPGPFAVAGYRMGFAALRELKIRRGSFDLEVIHYAPAKVQWSCIVDGLQAATGASLGKLNLSLKPAPETAVRSVLRNRKTGQTIHVSLQPEFVKSFWNVPMERLAEAGAKVADLPEEKVFSLRPARP